MKKVESSAFEKEGGGEAEAIKRKQVCVETYFRKKNTQLLIKFYRLTLLIIIKTETLIKKMSKKEEKIPIILL